MLKALIKKQFTEIFRSYFVNPKTGKARSNSGIVGMFIMFAGIMLLLCGIFFAMAAMCGELIAAGMAWLYFAVMGMVSVALGAFGSVFNTYASLYLAKDNEQLLSMPIPPRMILTARTVLVFGMGLMYSGCVWLPSIVFYWIVGHPAPIAVVFDVLLIFVIALFVTVITCVLGWLVALISSRIKSKSFITVFISLAFFAAYYFVCFRMTELLENLILNSEAVGQSLRTWANMLYQLGGAACGSIPSMLIFTLTTLVLTGICGFVLSKTFHRIITRSETVEKVSAKKTVIRESSIRSALFNRELKRFTSSPTYMLNCGLGIVILPVLAVVAVLKRETVLPFIEMVNGTAPEYAGFIPLVLIFIVCSVVSLNVISTPSVSLEGRNLWILKAMPVQTREILAAKESLHLLLNAVPALLSIVAVFFCFRLDGNLTVLAAVQVLLFIRFTAVFGLMLGIKRPNFNWTSESMPIKQSSNILVALLVGWLSSVALCAGFFLLRKLVDVQIYLVITIAVLAAVDYLLENWLRTKGAKEFESL